MSIQKKIITDIKEAMKSKDTVALVALRSLKSAFMLVKTQSENKQNITEIEELKIVQKQVKQRKDSAKVFLEQGRKDLADAELAESKILERFLPKSLSNEEIEKIVEDVIYREGASSIKDMGKIMAIVSKKTAGKAEGKTISLIVKSKLN